MSKKINEKWEVIGETNPRDKTMGLGVSWTTDELPGVPQISFFAGLFV
ncbi:hypothetical protein CHISP_3544 [Chitinispirillum alkaliphilum]|nr:hypothetical protein CHISP_3544 [Chitinispirillum alkaliphilum]